MTQVQRILIEAAPYTGNDRERPWPKAGEWPAAWVTCADAGDAPFVTAYRRSITVDKPVTLRIHVTADERYELYLDGERIGRGSERGTVDAWFHETYELALKPGPHTVVARVWSLGARAPFAQMSLRAGFLLAAEGAGHELLTTGVADWEAKALDGYAFLDPAPAWGTGCNVEVDGTRYPWGVERGEGEGWTPVVLLEPGRSRLSGYEFFSARVLRPATLPAMLDRGVPPPTVRFVGDADGTLVRLKDHLSDETAGWTDLVAGRRSLTIPASTTRRILLDLVTYTCAYPELVTSGGARARVRVHWMEALVHDPAQPRPHKGNRNEIDGKHALGVGDSFLPDGGARRRFGTLWWQAGRYVEILVRTADQPLTIDHLGFRETRYPLEMESSFDASDPRLPRVAPILVRGMQMCAHETYMDCPYYEQLMYAGDTRLEALTTYVMTVDDRLPRKALHLFNRSRLPMGLTQARFPSRVLQIIVPFCLWWVAMVRDYAFWRGDRATLDALMPGVRATLDAVQSSLGEDGLVHAPEGWNFMDWVPAWAPGGVPPDAGHGASGPVNWQLVLVLSQVADLERRLGESELAARTQRHAGALAERAMSAFWDQETGLLSDDLARSRFSEHTQCLALLGGHVPPDKKMRIADGLLHNGDLARTTIYFSHYLFETYRKLGRIDAMFDRLGLWFDLAENGLTTPIEMPEPSRSDCHAWGAHPLYHMFASILGIRPADVGFQTVRIRPQLGPLTHASGRLVHPAGEIAVDVRSDAGRVRGTVELPPGVTGTLHLGDAAIPLQGGKTTF